MYSGVMITGSGSRIPSLSFLYELGNLLNLSVPQTSHQMAELMVAPAPYRSAQRVKGVNGHTRGGRDVINRGQERRRVGGGVMSLFSY